MAGVLFQPRSKAGSNKGAVFGMNKVERPDELRHDAEEWKRLFDAAVEKSDREQIRGLRIHVQSGTLGCLAAGRYFASVVDNQVVLPMETLSLKVTRPWNHEDDKTAKFGPRFDKPPEISVRNIDCLEACRVVQYDSPQARVAVLNMANQSTPGGGWKGGCGAQEENLFRRTNLVDRLSDFRRKVGSLLFAEGHAPPLPKYPLPAIGGAYSADVCVFRGPESDGYPLLVKPFYVDVITVAACRKPKLTKTTSGEDRLDRKRETITFLKIRTMLRMAAASGADTLVLSAFGCGAFGNPPKHIAELFKTALDAEEFAGVFRQIVFAIIEDHNSPPGGNIEPFARVFKTIAIDMSLRLPSDPTQPSEAAGACRAVEPPPADERVAKAIEDMVEDEDDGQSTPRRVEGEHVNVPRSAARNPEALQAAQRMLSSAAAPPDAESVRRSRPG